MALGADIKCGSRSLCVIMQHQVMFKFPIRFDDSLGSVNCVPYNLFGYEVKIE